MRTKPIIVILILGQLLFFGCATAKGPLFKEVSPEDYQGKAIIYFFRNSEAAAASPYELTINSGKPLLLRNKGYRLLVLDPGTYDFSLFYKNELKAESTFTFKEAKAYFIRYRIEVLGYTDLYLNPIYNYSMIFVPREKALEHLKSCRLIQ